MALGAPRRRALRRALLLLLGLAATPLLAGAALAGPSLGALVACTLSTDVTVDLDPGAATLAASPSRLIDWSAPGDAALGDELAVAGQPAANVDAFHDVGNGFRLLSYDIAVQLADLTVAHPADVIIESAPPAREQDLFFDHRQFGIGDAADIDALAVFENSLVFSFASTTVVRAGEADELAADPRDLLAVDLESGDIEVVFRGAAFGVLAGVNLDAAEIVDRRLLASFDVASVVPSESGLVAFADEDVLVFDPETQRWSLGLDASAEIAGLEPADVDAISGCRFLAEPPTPTPTATVPPTATATPTRSATRTATATVTSSAPPPATATATPPAGATATASATASPVLAACVGDCDGNGEVAINELIAGVNIALGSTALSACPSVDPTGDGQAGIAELVQAVNNALNGCA